LDESTGAADDGAVLAAHAARLQPDLVELRRLHRTPELGLDLPETQSTVLDAHVT
jgi:hippurate hydrolase